jgi:NAD-dependent dihydropyrimidine dehydrogenase PreA subunit
VKLSKVEEDNCHSLQPLGVQFEDCTTCDSAVEVCGVQNINQVLDQHLTQSEEESKE